MEKNVRKQMKASAVINSTIASASLLQALLLHLVCGTGLAVAFWLAQNTYSINLISNPTQTLCLIWVLEAPIVILFYSCFRKNPNQCSYFKAVARGFCCLPFGAVVNALGGIVLGSPFGIQYLPKTVNWSLLMSSLTFVPAAAVFGSSWADWHRIFAKTKPVGSVDYMICLSAHGAIVGAWFGSWPMPLDWERPWQDWPVCVTYGAVAGYFFGMAASLCFIFFCNRQHAKIE